MPITNPTPQRKIGPESLAFETSGKRGGGGSSFSEADVTYQIDVVNNLVLGLSEREAYRAREEAGQIAAASAMMSEVRAKLYAAHKRSLFYDISAAAAHPLNLNAWSPLHFDNEILRVLGAGLDGVPSANGTGFEYRVVGGDAGVWHFDVFFMASLDSLWLVDLVELAVFKNGALYKVVDIYDEGHAGEAPIIDAKVRAHGVPVDLATGDVVTFAVYMYAAGATGWQSPLVAPNDVFGYVAAHRQACRVEVADIPQQAGYITT